MKITAIRYGRLQSLPEFNNVRVEMEAELYPHELTNEAFAALKAEVDGRLGLVADVENLEARKQRLCSWISAKEAEREQLKVEIESLRATVREACAIVRNLSDLAELGRREDIEGWKKLSDCVDDELPF